ncbi:MAG: glycosyltransferase [Solirubrobacteraceae bacterium]
MSAASSAPRASILIPTRARADYLALTLESIVPQAQAAGAEVIVISDGVDAATAALADRGGAKLVTLSMPRCLNAARNAGVAAARGELVVFVDDDVLAPAGWLDAILQGAAGTPGAEVLGGPIRPLLEGGGPRACGREPAPITALDLGERDGDARFVWGANMAIRAGALRRVGPFDETLSGRGDEEDWLRRYAAAGGRVRYLAAAGLHHRRSAEDATVARMSRAAYALGRTARRNDERVGSPKAARHELRIAAGCAWHSARRRCAFGIVLFAHTAGRLHEMLDPQPDTGPSDRGLAGTPAGGDGSAPAEDFLSGTSGQVSGIRATSRALLADAIADALAFSTRARLRRAAATAPRRRVLVLGIERTEAPNLMAAARKELASSHHEVEIVTAPAGERGKFENLNALLAEHPAEGADWLLVIDDDVSLPAGFLDAFIFLAERFDLRLAQPAHRNRSHAAWALTRRRPLSVARETAFVEIGPVFAFHRDTFDVLLPFPPLRAGWGLDHHWSAVAREHGWRLGVVDGTPVGHRLRTIAASYDISGAIEEAREFLRERPYVRAAEIQRPLAVHRSW